MVRRISTIRLAIFLARVVRMIPNQSDFQAMEALQPDQLVQASPTDQMHLYPELASSVQLMGELPQSGFKDRQWLIQRDGQFIQLTELLYRIVEQVDGTHSYEEIARMVTETTEWEVRPDQVYRLIQTKLAPLGIFVSSISKETEDARIEQNSPARSPLRINMRMKMISPRFIVPLSKLFRVLYAPPLLIPILLVVLFAHLWLYFVHGVGRAITESLTTPGYLLIILLLLLVTALFHELGHATALNYGGGEVRGIGAGFYLIYPALYTDVTDSYRLGRWARVRTDLGGFYFSLIVALAMMGLALMFKLEFLLVVVLLIDLDILFQCLPFVRMDGYWALTDLTGVPDLLSQTPAFLRSIFPFLKWSGNKLPELKLWVKVVFGGYILSTFCVFSLFILFTLVDFPALLITLWNNVLDQEYILVYAHRRNDLSGMVLTVAQIIIFILPVIGGMYIFLPFGKRAIWAFWHWSKVTTIRRIGSIVGSCGLLVILTFFWLQQIPFTNGAMQLAQTVDGIPCDRGEYSTEHIHAHLTIFVLNREVTIPENIGIAEKAHCYFWLHTQQADGVIHVEAPAQRAYTLGQFMDVWAQTKQTSILSRKSFLSHPLQDHQLTIWTATSWQPPVPYTGNIRNLVLQNLQLITIAYDSPQVRPLTHFDWKHSSAPSTMHP